MDEVGSHQYLDIFRAFVRKNACFNDYAECIIHLI